MTHERRRESGETILLCMDGFGFVFRMFPAVVVADSDDVIAMYTSEHAPYLRLVTDENAELPRVVGPDELRSWSTRQVVKDFGARSRLVVARPGDAHAVFIEWTQPGWIHREWYVNFQQPLERTTDGFRTTDLVLDLVVQPDRTWQWKDEHELQASVENGRLSTREVSEILRHAKSVRSDVESWGWPFSSGYENWRPPEDMPELDVESALALMRS